MLKEKRANKMNIVSAKRVKNLSSEQNAGKKGKRLLSEKDVIKNSKKREKTKVVRAYQFKKRQICSLCLECYNEDWIQCRYCETWLNEPF